MTDFDAAAALSEIAEATEHLLEDAAMLSEQEMHAPSALPNWTRAHVLTHIARNADGMVNMLTTASTGVVIPMYPSSEARDAEIEAGADRPAADIVADVRDSAERFRVAYEAVGPEQWDTDVYRTPDTPPISARGIGGRRLNEVLVHHVDLDTDYTPAHWPIEFAEYEFAECLTRFDGRDDFPPLRLHVEETDTWHGIHAEADDASVATVHGPQRALLAWLMGRASGDGLVTEPPEGGRGPLPEIPSWG